MSRHTAPVEHPKSTQREVSFCSRSSREAAISTEDDVMTPLVPPEEGLRENWWFEPLTIRRAGAMVERLRLSMMCCSVNRLLRFRAALPAEMEVKTLWVGSSW